MKKISLLWVALAIFGLGACKKVDDSTDQNEVDKNEQAIDKYTKDNNLTTVRDSSGLYYVKTVTNSSGNKPKIGDEVAINFVIHRLTDGFVVGKSDSLLRYPLGINLLKPGIERSVSLLRSGEKGTFLLPFYLMFGSAGIDNVPPYSPIRMELEVVQVRNEAEQIADYIANNKLIVSETTPNGVRIVRLNTVTGDSLGKGKTVNVKYVGKLLSNKVFDKGSLEVNTGSRGTVVGFDEGISHLRKGEKAILIFPSSIGYGAKGAGKDILPYAPLVFEIEVPK